MPLAEVERGEGVAERVEAGPGRSDLLDQRLEDPAAEVVGVERAARFVGEGEGGRVLIVRAARCARSFAASGAGRRTSRRPYLVFGGSIRPLTMRAADADSGVGSSSWTWRRCRAIASLIRRPRRRQELEEQPVALGRHREDGRELLAAEDLDSRRPRRVCSRWGRARPRAGLWRIRPSRCRGRQRGAQRDHRRWRSCGRRAACPAPPRRRASPRSGRARRW